MATATMTCADLPQPKRTRRKMTDGEKADYRKRRQLRACRSCAVSKRKCSHSQPMKDDGERTWMITLRSGNPSPAPEAMPLSTGNAVGVWDDDGCEGKPEDDLTDMPPRNPRSTTLLKYKPQCAEDLSIILYLEDVTRQGVLNSWWAQAPSRIGHNVCFDLAVATVQTSCWYARGLPGATQAKLFRALDNALAVLNTAMTEPEAVFNDHTLATIASLTPVEAIRAGHAFIVPAHLDGLTEIIVHRASVGRVGALAHRILEYHQSDVYVMACVRGQPSPLENIDAMYWRSTEGSRPLSEQTLRSMGNELCVKLPRLTALVRDICAHAAAERPDTVTVSSALSLAESLATVKDEAAEKEYLSQMKPAATPEERFTKHFRLYETFSSVDAGLYYWQGRIAVLRLCYRLRSFYGTLCDVFLLPSKTAIEAQWLSCVTNIFTTADYARSTRLSCKRRRLFGHALVVCWGVLRDCPDLFSIEDSQGKRDLTQLRGWILDSANLVMLQYKSPLTATDLDVAADLFIGGDLAGAYKIHYEGSQPRSTITCLMRGNKVYASDQAVTKSNQVFSVPRITPSR